MPASESASSRVLILAPIGRDAELARRLLEREHLDAEACSDVGELIYGLEAGAGAAVIADEALNGRISLLHDWVEAQPAWSDFPFIILTAGRTLHADMRRRFEAIVPLGNVTLLERPLRSRASTILT